MQVVTSIAEMRRVAHDLRAQGRTLALVPTMGALHEGHLSLLRRAQRDGEALIASIFLNPKQFGPGEDYTRYPRDLECDLDMLRPCGLEAVFAPDAAEMYPADFSTQVETGILAGRWEGASRPGHFRGVATVVLKLLNIVSPDVTYFGQKDLQQILVIRRMLDDFNLTTRIRVCPTVREPDGLALSSRNGYLQPEDRRAAAVLYRSLSRARELFDSGEVNASRLMRAMRAELALEPKVKPDYLAIADPLRLAPLERATTGSIALIAGSLGSVRLIDNVILGPSTASDEELIRIAFDEKPGSTG